MESDSVYTANQMSDFKIMIIWFVLFCFVQPFETKLVIGPFEFPSQIWLGFKLSDYSFLDKLV